MCRVVPSHCCRYGAVPPNSATQMEYGTPTPTVRMLVGNSSAYTAGTIAALAAMKMSITDMLTASCHAESLSSQVIGKCITAEPMAPDHSTFLRPILSDNLPH